MGIVGHGRKNRMSQLRLILAILIALALGLAPALAGVGKPSMAAMPDCAGKAKPACPCDDGPSPCQSVGCKLACGSIIGLPPTFGLARAERPAETTDMTVPELRPVRPWSDPPVPRS